MITLHPEQHRRHRKQRQATSESSRNPQDPYQRHCKPSPTSKILVNENTRTHSLPTLKSPLHQIPHPTTPTRPTNTPSSPPQKPPHTSNPTVRHDTPPASDADKASSRPCTSKAHSPSHPHPLADLHITIRIERHHRTVYLPLRT